MITAIRTNILKLFLYVFAPHPSENYHELFKIRSYSLCVPRMCPRPWHLGFAQLILIGMPHVNATGSTQTEAGQAFTGISWGSEPRMGWTGVLEGQSSS